MIDFKISQEAKNSIIVHFDGACKINPRGAIGWGCTIEWNDGRRECLFEGLGADYSHSSNVAEYCGLIMALNKLIELGYGQEDILIKGDSKLVICQMTGHYSIKKGLYRKYAIEAKRLVKRFSSISFEWIPRNENIEADYLANKGIEDYY